MTRRSLTLILLLALSSAGCGKFYWQASGRESGRDPYEFVKDNTTCIADATSKYEASERVYRRCMRAHGWERVQTNYPNDRQFRGPESEEDFFRPPDPLGARGDRQRLNDPTCTGSTAARPSHCRR